MILQMMSLCLFTALSVSVCVLCVHAPRHVYTNLCAIHAKRVTIMPKDMQLARRIRGKHSTVLGDTTYEILSTFSCTGWITKLHVWYGSWLCGNTLFGRSCCQYVRQGCAHTVRAQPR